ncbi:hypothetical protein A0H81_09454 [Grifola frondosa]|uniref:Uncharacterized protein n=1 Tax=Grifola frondosa TaxID=5627 RepID=A0A1C7M1I8_GRIFR|nr:hypothetical protein A0H81_09454 [Grifola frondosa]
MPETHIIETVLHLCLRKSFSQFSSQSRATASFIDTSEPLKTGSPATEGEVKQTIDHLQTTQHSSFQISTFTTRMPLSRDRIVGYTQTKKQRVL